MKPRHAQLLATVVMLALSVRIVQLWISGELLFYIHPSTSWWVGSGGIVLGILAIFWSRLPMDHLHITNKQLFGVVMISTLIVLSPNVPLSAALAPKREGGLNAPVSNRTGIRPGAITQEFTILEWLTAWESDPTYQKYVGSDVRVVGFLTEVEGEIFINRYMVTCCAVDAQLLRIEVANVTGDVPSGWVELRGTMGRDGEYPSIQFSEVTSVAQPVKPYLY